MRNWVVIGTGVIANEMAKSLEKNNERLYGVANRTRQKAIDFKNKYNVTKVYDDINDVFNDPDVDVIYLTTPHNTHYEFIKKALNNGKHVLAEKAITLNSKELDEVISLAKEKNLLIGEAMTLYHMPLYRKLEEIINDNKLGKVNLITMNFGSYKEYDMNNRFFNRKLAGGAMLDIGVYALSFVRFFFKSKPTKTSSFVKYAPTGVDEEAAIILKNDDNQMATVMISLHSKQPKRGMVSCEKGYIEIMEYPRATEAKIFYVDTGKEEIIKDGDMLDALYYEVKDFEKAIDGNKNILRLNYTKDVMDLMSKFRKEWNFKYPEEEKQLNFFFKKEKIK